MARFQLDNYETVKARKDRFYTDHPEGVILAFPRQITDEQASFTVAVWKDRDDYEGGRTLLASCPAGLAFDQMILVMGPDAMGTAYEAKWMAGASKTSWTENCEESAIGRALDNLGYHGNGKCSREEIEKATRAQAQLDAQAEEDDRDTAAAVNVDLKAFPHLLGKIREMKGKKGVRELRQILVHAAMLSWDEPTLEAWIKDQLGADLNGAPAEEIVKLRDALKKERGVGA